MLGKVALVGVKRRELYDILQGRDYEQLKDLTSDRSSRDRISSKKACQKPVENSKRLRSKDSCKYYCSQLEI